MDVLAFRTVRLSFDSKGNNLFYEYMYTSRNYSSKLHRAFTCYFRKNDFGIRIRIRKFILYLAVKSVHITEE